MFVVSRRLWRKLSKFEVLLENGHRHPRYKIGPRFPYRQVSEETVRDGISEGGGYSLKPWVVSKDSALYK